MTGTGSPERIELDRSELEAILERAKTAALSQEEYAKLHAVTGVPLAREKMLNQTVQTIANVA